MLASLRVRPFAQRWLLALALLLPLAQGAAWLHTLSHATGGAAHTAQHESSEGLVQDLCELCLAAAHLAGTAPGPDAAPTAATAAATATPQAGPVQAAHSAPYWRHGARGPPERTAAPATLTS
ncbi:hypothetical protein [Roseateles paludis]|jgi:hypothetical protein|uniref:DUF2946 domain-containing protein n=1 Tax=Roseateles paludis TaxID=3145238 RepID=A0ABV0G1I0_9BURK